MTSVMGFGQIAGAVAAAGTGDYVGRLVDFVGSIAAHDRVTVARYSSCSRPVFVTHRNFSQPLIERYLSVYYAFDPFDAYWRDRQRPGVVPLRTVMSPRVKKGRYVAEFLDQSAIRDEVGILLADGPDATLGVFLERSRLSFGGADIERLESAFPAIAALHDVHRRLNGDATALARTRTSAPSQLPPLALWPRLSPRERDIAGLILAGHPTSSIAARLGISPGTIRNHRHRIHDKLDITSEREMFLQYVAFLSPPQA